MSAQPNNERPDLLAAYWTVAGDVYPSAPSEISPHSFVERVVAAAEAGYRGVGLIHANLMHQAGLIGLGTMRNILDDHDLQHVELELLVDWFANGEKKSASDRMLDELCEAATILGARDLKIAGNNTGRTSTSTMRSKDSPDCLRQQSIPAPKSARKSCRFPT